jgi:dihydropyrimidinase
VRVREQGVWYYTPWEGYEVTGWPHATILRGEVVMQEGEILGSKQGGRFLPRALSPMAGRGAGAPMQ